MPCMILTARGESSNFVGGLVVGRGRRVLEVLQHRAPARFPFRGSRLIFSGSNGDPGRQGLDRLADIDHAADYLRPQPSSSISWQARSTAASAVTGIQAFFDTFRRPRCA